MTELDFQPELEVMIAVNRYCTQSDLVQGDIDLLEQAGVLAGVVETPGPSLSHTTEFFAGQMEQGQTWVALGGDTTFSAVAVAQYLAQKEDTSAVAAPRGGHSDYSFSAFGLTPENCDRRLLQVVTSPDVASVGLIAVERWAAEADISGPATSIFYAVGQVGFGASARVVECFNDTDVRKAKEESRKPGGVYDLGLITEVARTNEPFPFTEVIDEGVPAVLPVGQGNEQEGTLQLPTLHEVSFINMLRIGGQYHIKDANVLNQELVAIVVDGRKWLLGQFVLRGARATAPARWVTGGAKGQTLDRAVTLTVGTVKEDEAVSVHHDGEDGEPLTAGTTVRVSLVQDAFRIRGPKRPRRLLGKQG
jgi:hypothetical protein